LKLCPTEWSVEGHFLKRSILAISARHFCLAAGDAPGRVRFLSQAVTLAEGATQTWVTLTRTGSFNDPRYGNFAITPDMLGQMVANFDTRVLGQDVFIDVSHKPSDGAAGKVLKLSVEGGRLRALVEWTPFGVDAIKQRGFTYLSAEYHEQWKDNEKQQPHGCVLLGAGLTVRPVIKNLDPVQLSDDDHAAGDPVRTAISPSLFKELTEFSMNYLDQLRAKYKAMGLSDELSTKLLAEAKKQFDEASADAVKCLALVATWEAAGQSVTDQLKALGQGNPAQPQNVTIQLAAPAGAPVDVNAAVQKALADRDTAAAAAVTTLAAKHKLLSDTIAEGDKTLTPEGVKKFAEDYAPLVTAESTDAQVKHLATLAVAQAKALSAAQKLTGLGYNPASGTVHISVDSSNSIKSLQATIDTRLGFTDTDTRRFDRTGGTLLASNRAFAEKALAQFDAENGHRLDAEHKALASGTGSISDVAVPVIAERTVLREALYNLNSLNFMNVGTAPFANVITIPYSYRDTTAAGVSALRRYEAQGIRRAGVIQTTEEARPIPQKLAFLISSELQLLMGASVIDFDPISENIRNIIRIVGEDTEAINMNELVNAADEYSVTTITDTLTAQVDGTNTVFVTTKFPVVKPRKVYDLKGVQVGTTVNPIVVTLNAVARNEYLANADGSALAAGTYYIMDYNLGELRFVTEAGVAVVPTAAWVLTVAYSYSTNRATFDTDAVVSESIGDRYDRLLVAIGNRKVVVGTDRFYNPNMVLMSNAIDNALSQATSFTANGARNGNGLNADGSVGITKGMGTFNPRAPGLQLADTRIIVGERGNTRFRMVKPFAMNPIEQARDSNGKFTDQRESFGTQFVVSHTPSQIKGACSSIILFSTAGRVARVA
jgi:hypothetical protein